MRINQIALRKGQEIFVFRWQDDCEEDLLRAMAEQAESGQTNFSWSDAAYLCSRLAKQILMLQADELIISL